jgi:putative intracellular protease/amidase
MGKHLAVVLLDDFADWEVGFLTAAARTWLGAEISYFTPGRWPVRSMGGMLLDPDEDLATLPALGPDGVVLVGSKEWEGSAAPAIEDVVPGILGRGVPVGAICGATVGLARAGLLAGRRHTSNSRDYLDTHAPGYAGRDLFQTSAVAVLDRGLVTAPGSAPASFAAAMLSLVWPESADTVAGFADLMGREHRVAA